MEGQSSNLTINFLDVESRLIWLRRAREVNDEDECGFAGKGRPGRTNS
jgi:hypothetical protein